MKMNGIGRLKENKGSSLIMALVVVSFIAVIAMTITTISLSSYKIKAMEAKTKNAFYNADMAVDEIYARGLLLMPTMNLQSPMIML